MSRRTDQGGPELVFRELRGAEVAPVLDDLGRLRVAVFREFPYLYDGDLDYEREYLRVYADSAESLVVVAECGGGIVGACTCLPMRDEGPEFQAPFREAGFDVGEVFYFGESILLPEFRGLGAGHEFFDRRERQARELGYRYTTFCAVDRAADHPRRGADYRPLDGFWTRRGYERQDDLRCVFRWKEIGEEEESPKSLTFWLRDWEDDQAGAR